MAVALLAATALVVGGCSGGSDDSKADNGNDKSAASSPSSTTTTTFKFEGNDSEAWCKADREVNEKLGTSLPTDATPAQQKERFEQTIAALEDLHQKASAEIKGSVATIRDAYRDLGPALEKVGYDPAKLDAETQAAVNTPEMQEAAARLGAYERQVCKFTPTG